MMDNTNQRKCLWPLVVVALAVLVVFAQTGFFHYIFLDDPEYTMENPFVKEGLTWSGIVTAFTNLTWGGAWYPLTYLSYMVDISVFGARATGHHVMNVFYHLINAGLFFLLLQRIFGKGRPWLVAAMTIVWAVHPIRAESVAWIASRKDLIFTLLLLVGLHAWLSCRWFVSLLMMGLAVMGKPTAMAFPFVCLGLDLLTGRPLVRRKVLSYALMLVLAVVIGLLTCYSQTHITGLDKPDASVIDVRGLYEGYGSFGWRLLNAAVSLGMYFYHFVTTRGIYLLYLPNVGELPDDTWLGLPTLAVVTALFVFLFVRFSQKRRLIAGCALWFAATLGPTLGIAGGFGCQAYADRFTYFPFLAVSVLGCGLLWDCGRERIVGGVLAALCLFFTATGFMSAATFYDNIAVFENAVVRNPQHYVACSELGSEYCRMGHVDEGIRLLRHCLRIQPTPEVAAHLAEVLAVRCDIRDLAEIKELCSHVAPDATGVMRVKADDAMGTAAMFERRWDDAIALFRKVLASKFADRFREDTKMKLAMSYFNKRDFASAQQAIRPLVNSKRPEVRTKAMEIAQAIWQSQ